MPRLQIEKKHTYKSYNALICGVTTDSQVAQTHYNYDRPLITGDHPNYPVTGTDENNRIGRKIRTESLVSEFFINLYNTMDNDNFNTIYDYFTYSNSDTQQSITDEVSPQQAPFNTNEQNLDISIRHFIIEFDRDFLGFYDPLQEDAFYKYFDWFYQKNIFTGNYNMHSNRQQVMRESTEYTGNYNVLYDKMIHLSLARPLYHGNVSIPYVRNLSFDGVGSELPSNKVVMQFFIGPTNPMIDYGNFNLGQFITNNAPDGGPNLILAELSNTLKLNYTDV